MKTCKHAIRFLVMATSLVSGAALAQSGPAHYVYAPVVDYEPIDSSQRIPVEREVCWREHGYRRHRGGSATGTIAGAIIGGVIGNQFGGGSGKKALTAAGAALGASVGHDATRDQRRRQSVSYEHCEIRVEYEYRDYISGYRVHYQYEGGIYETRMQTPPGETIRLEVSARPVH